MLLLLGLVIVGIVEASQPANWEWLTSLSKNSRADRVSEGEGRNRSPGEVRESLEPGEFRLVAGDRDPSGISDSELPPAGAGQDDLSIPPEILRPITDATLGIRKSESAAYFLMLNKARDAAPDRFERAGSSHTTYAELMNDPERHRGDLITIEGELRRLTTMPAGENDEGFETLYDGWLFTDAAGKKSPYRVIGSGKPEGMPEGDQIRERVRWTGYFFKRCNYETAHGLHAAPLLLGREVRWITSPAPGALKRRTPAVVSIGLCALAALFVSGLWWRFAHERRRQAARRHQRVQVEGGDLASLGDFPLDDPAGSLRDLNGWHESDERREA